MTGFTLVAPRRDPAMVILRALDEAGYRVVRTGGSPVDASLFDTHDGRLAAAGATLQYEAGGGSWRLASAREVVEENFGHPERPAVDGAIAERVGALAGRRGLVSFVELRGDSESFIATPPAGGDVELRITRAAVTTPLRPQSRVSLPTCRVEARDDAEAARVVAVLRDLGRCRLDPRPLLELALAALRVLAPGTPPPDELDVSVSDDALTAASKLLARQAWIMETNAAGTRLDLDPEFLHDLRVASRRSRAALRLLRPVLAADESAALREELSWLGGVCGAVRDLDVFRERLSTSLAKVEAVPECRERIAVAIAADREARRAELVEALSSERWAELLTTLRSIADRPPAPGTTEIGPDARIAEVAPVLVGRELRRLTRWRGRIRAGSAEEDLHRLRIDAKRARYACEFFERVLAADPSRTIRALVRVQDRLGAHQDAVVAQARLERLAAERYADDADLRELLVLGAVIQLERGRRRELRGGSGTPIRKALARAAGLRAALATDPPPAG